MNNLEKINLWQTIFTGATFIGAMLATWFAYKIGKKQNKINEQALNISNFVEIFLMPQQVITQNRDNSEEKIIKWNVLIKNVSSYPVYLNDFVLNGIKQDVGNSAIPNNPDSWYGLPITDDVQKKGDFSLLVSFEDYLGHKYQTEGFGKFNGYSWDIKSKKRIEV